MSWLFSILLLASASTTSVKPTKLEFGFLYDKGWGTVLDAYHRTVSRGDTTVSLSLSQADLDSVWQKMIEVHFFDLKEPHPDYGSSTWGQMKPNTTIRLEGTLGFRTRRLNWNSGYIVKNEGEWKAIGELQVLIDRVLGRQPQYEALSSREVHPF